MDSLTELPCHDETEDERPVQPTINGLTVDEQLEVVRGLGKYLYNQGVVTDTVRFSLNLKGEEPSANAYQALECISGELFRR